MRALIPLIALGASFLALPVFAQNVRTFTGTGFVVSNEGYIVTNAHVVPACKTVNIIQGNAYQPASIVATDTAHDLALLKVVGTMPNVGKLRSNTPQVNETVVVVGHPQNGPLTTKSATLLKLTGPNNEPGFLNFSSAAIQGNSGGPLLDTGGNIIGVVNAIAVLTERNVTAARDEVISNSNVAITLDYLRMFLNSKGVRYQESQTTPGTLSADRVEDRAKEFVVKIHCLQ